VAQPIDYFSDESLRRDLKGKTVRSGLAVGTAQACLMAMQFGSIPILTRLLTPADFGLVAMVTVVTGFASMFVDAGLSMATVQRDKITHQQVTNLFWLAVLLGSGIAAIVAAMAPAIAWFYSEPRLVAVTLVLAISFVFSGLTIQHQALLTRSMQFKKLTVIQVVAAALGHITAISWAWYFHSYWALVFRPLVIAVAQAVGTIAACHWRPGLPQRGTGVRQLAYFGFHLAGFNLINYLARNADYMLIGWRWGAVPLGFYERAYRLLMYPIQQINYPISNVAIPALSRLQSEPAKYIRAYESMIGKLIFASGTVVGFLIVTSDWVIQLFMGDQWLDSIPIFQWLAFVAVRQAYLNTTSWLFVSQGRSREMLHWAFIGVPISIASFVVGLPYGPKGVAMAYAIIPFILTPPILFWMLGRRGPMSNAYLWKFYLYAMHVPLCVGAVTYGARLLLKPTSPLVGIVMLAPVAGVTTLALMAFTTYGRLQFRESLEMVVHLLRAAQLRRRNL
jgi:polysaccharide transporter, PST family